jgi:hypothetical protein
MINTCHCTEQKEAPAFAASWSSWVAALHLQRCSMGTPSRAKSICLQRMIQLVSLRRTEDTSTLLPSATDPTWFPALWTRNSMTHWFFSELKPCMNGGMYARKRQRRVHVCDRQSTGTCERIAYFNVSNFSYLR